MQVLQDAERRAAYDRQLALGAASQVVHINETVLLEDMEPDVVQLPAEHHQQQQHAYTWPCRCGGSYLLLAQDAAAAAGGDAAAATAAGGEPEVVVPCSTCSLHIRVLLGAQQ